MPETSGPATQTIGPATQTVSDGRFTFKKPHLEFLGNPTQVDVSYGPGKSILIHNPERRRQFVDRLLGDVEILDSDETQVEFRLDNMCETVPIDEQGRMRIPGVFLERAALEEKGVKAYIIPSRRTGWLEIYNHANFLDRVDKPEDDWRQALDRVIKARREEQARHEQRHGQ